jgi:hypothetical protein
MTGGVGGGEEDVAADGGVSASPIQQVRDTWAETLRGDDDER